MTGLPPRGRRLPCRKGGIWHDKNGLPSPKQIKDSDSLNAQEEEEWFNEVRKELKETSRRGWDWIASAKADRSGQCEEIGPAITEPNRELKIAKIRFAFKVLYVSVVRERSNNHTDLHFYIVF
ncbi:hypothetical protein SELMODRAFT_412991 [Selaginella moellendorffii]|uniref:Uncharacterized protein n=1 Tax=Selaginella moellendorffii TaxID=88036 RepID=D8RN01_SELML|nr:hypothetical protein SELMODRAFT_412991 [Selaginella moellendorffii]